MARSECMRRKSTLRLWWLERFSKRNCGLGRPMEANFVVRVFYGGYWCEEALLGPYATIQVAAEVRQREWDKGYGALVLRCENITAEVLRQG